MKENMVQPPEKNKINTGKILAGMVLLAAGILLLVREMGYSLPYWLFTWQMLLIVIGLFVGVKNLFRGYGWLILIGIGLVSLLDDIRPSVADYIWPSIIIFAGLIMIIRPGRKKPKVKKVKNELMKDDILDAAAVFGAVNKIILSKNFKGGELAAVFGGAEVNLSQADFDEPVKIEVAAIFGGVKLIIPANWEIRSEVAAVFGGVDDKRDVTSVTNPERVLVLEGVAVCGGIEIVSF